MEIDSSKERKDKLRKVLTIVKLWNFSYAEITKEFELDSKKNGGYFYDLEQGKLIRRE